MNTQSCRACGAGEMVAGNVQSTGLVRFRPSTAKFMTFHTADVAISAQMCTACGALVLHGDTEKLQQLRKNDSGTTRTPASACQAT